MNRVALAVILLYSKVPTGSYSRMGRAQHAVTSWTVETESLRVKFDRRVIEIHALLGGIGNPDMN